MKSSAKLESLAVLGATQTVALGDAALDEVADLCLRLHQEAARRNRAILTPSQTRTYAARSDAERAGMRAAVRHVITALVLLDFIARPT